MSKLSDILIRQMGGAGPVGSIRDQLGELRQRFGSNRKAAKFIGVNESTFRRILAGTSRGRPSTLDRIRDGVRTSRVREFDRGDLRLKFNYDGRDRRLGADNLRLRPGTVESMRTAYQAGNEEGVARAFIDGIGDPWYQERFDETYEGQQGDYGGDFAAA